MEFSLAPRFDVEVDVSTLIAIALLQFGRGEPKLESLVISPVSLVQLHSSQKFQYIMWHDVEYVEQGFKLKLGEVVCSQSRRMHIVALR